MRGCVFLRARVRKRVGNLCGYASAACMRQTMRCVKTRGRACGRMRSTDTPRDRLCATDETARQLVPARSPRRWVCVCGCIPHPCRMCSEADVDLCGPQSVLARCACGGLLAGPQVPSSARLFPHILDSFAFLPAFLPYPYWREH